MTKVKSVAGNVCRFATIIGAIVLPQVAFAAPRTSVCKGSLGKLLPWISASQGPADYAPALVRQALLQIQDGDADRIVSYATSDRRDLASYVFKVQVLQNKHPGYYFWTKLYFDCSNDGTCQSFDFSNSRTINFPMEVNVYGKGHQVLAVAHGYDETRGVRSVERFLIAGDKLTKC